MAVNKRKILEAAQKFLQKGALDKALKEYRTLLDLDPRDCGVRLKLGDIYLRLGSRDDAVASYLKVAHQFMKDGFDAKAVALFKQIAKLAPEQIEVHVPLAELYQRLGLVPEAMLALQTAVEAYQKAGRKREALELLRKAAALDPTNTTSRLKIADLLRAQEMVDEALCEYEGIAGELERQGESDALVGVYERVLEIDPERIPAMLALAKLLGRGDSPERALSLAARAAELAPDSIDAVQAHAEAMQVAGRSTEEQEPVWRQLAELHRARGDEEGCRAILQRFCSAYDLTQNGVDLGNLQGDGVVLEAAGTAGEPGDLTRAAAALGRDLPPAEDLLAGPGASLAPAVPRAEPCAEGDTEQLLAEAGVYLRFGKRERAITSLEAILVREPAHGGAIEKLAEAFTQGGDSARAIEILSRGAETLEACGDSGGAATLRARLFDLDPSAAPGLDDMAVLVDPALPDVPADDLESLEIELDLSEDGGGILELERPADVEPGSECLELERAESEASPIEACEIESPPIAELEGEADAEEVSSIELGSSGADSATLGPSDAMPIEALAQAPIGNDGSSSASLSASPKQILEDLEEGDFYYQQALLEEAEAVYRRVLEVAPTNPQALLRLGEIAAARGHDPSASRLDVPVEPLAIEPEEVGISSTASEAELGDDLAEWSAESFGEDVEAPGIGLAGEIDAPHAESAAPTSEIDARPEEEEPIDLGSPGVEIDGGLEADSTVASPAPANAFESVVEPAGETSHFDLAAELSDALTEESTIEAPPPSMAPESEPSLDAIFSEFKRGVQRTLTAADHEAHYDLGIAYREMGLYEDAMAEFETALESPARRLDCLHLLGLCARDLKRPQDAVAFLQQALCDATLGDERGIAMRLELAIAFEEAGAIADALATLDEVARIAPGQPGVAERIDALRALQNLSADETPPAETPAGGEIFESFDDLIADAEAALVAGGPQAPAAAARRDADPSEPPPATPVAPPPRKRRISFG